tara:strand:- start:21 stop:206 length:186 start_codon:yes stop_codon:yes gene_type:complete
MKNLEKIKLDIVEKEINNLLIKYNGVDGFNWKTSSIVRDLEKLLEIKKQDVDKKLLLKRRI